VRCRTSRAAAEDSEATRALYPFAFRLVVTYTFDEAGLDVALKIVNTGEETLPASVGGHPFNWPLQLRADLCEQGVISVRRLDGGLLCGSAGRPDQRQGAFLIQISRSPATPPSHHSSFGPLHGRAGRFHQTLRGAVDAYAPAASRRKR
jgi:hypothetical protein